MAEIITPTCLSQNIYQESKGFFETLTYVLHSQKYPVSAGIRYVIVGIICYQRVGVMFFALTAGCNPPFVRVLHIAIHKCQQGDSPRAV